jgi:hypothetical protein
MEHILAFVGALVPLMSALASLINHVVREKTAAGEKVSPVLLQGRRAAERGRDQPRQGGAARGACQGGQEGCALRWSGC